MNFILDVFRKPFYEYTLLDELVILGLCIVGISAFFAIRLGILSIQIYFQNRRK